MTNATRARTALATIIVLLSLALRPLPAQPYGHGDLLASISWCMHRSCSGLIELRQPNGPTTTLAPWNSSYASPHVIMGPRNRSVLAVINGNAKLMSINFATRQAWTVAVPWPHYLGNGLVLSQTGRPATLSVDVGYNPHLIEVDPVTGAVTTIRAFLPVSGRVACRDLATGDFVFTNPTPMDAGVYRIGAQGQVTRVTNRVAFDVAQDHLDGSLLICYAGTLERRKGGASTTLVVGSFKNVTFDRAPGNGAIVATTTNAVYRFTRSGASVSSFSRLRVTDHAFARGCNLASESLPGRNHFRVNVSFPTDANRNYAIGLSATGFQPGVTLSGRRIPLIPDALFVTAARGNLGPLFRNVAGRLDAQGEANATLDLRRFGAILAGLRLWLAAITLDPNAPAGLGTISKPIIIVLD